MNPNPESPVIYPVDLGKEMILIKRHEDWLNLLDEQTGLVGWSLNENFSEQKPDENIATKDYDKSFRIFRERF